MVDVTEEGMETGLSDIPRSRMKAESQVHMTVSRLLRIQGAVVGLLAIGVMVLVALSASLIAPYDPTKASPSEAFGAPSRQHLLGTDYIGRDILSQLMFGARISLRMGVISVAIGGALGSIVGLLSGFYAHIVDAVIMRLVDMMLAFPGMILALSIVSVLGPSLTNVMIAVGLSLVPVFARLVRGLVLSEKEKVYIEAARAIGTPGRRIAFLHIFPNVLAPIIVVATLNIGNAIIAAAALSFLGLGAQPPTPEWGAMLAGGRNYLRDAWWMSTFPGLAIFVTVLAINMVGDGLRDALDPRLRI
jgi:peptide/nickel transport system permease protein